jgi:hypothetical protein
MSQFWWEDDDQQKHMHWFAWWKMCVPKYQGGMRFRDLHYFNIAMLAKQVWRIVSEPDFLCASILKAKYFPDGDILNGHVWRVLDGSHIDIWSDPWVLSSPNRRIATRRGNIVYSRVSDLIDDETERWMKRC